MIPEKRVKYSYFRVIGQIWCLAFLISHLLAPPLRSQKTTGTIFGSVRDSTGALIAGATVMVKNTDTGATRTVQTDDRGAYWVSTLSPGNYEVGVSKTRFKAAHRAGIGLDRRWRSDIAHFQGRRALGPGAGPMWQGHMGFYGVRSGRSQNAKGHQKELALRCGFSIAFFPEGESGEILMDSLPSASIEVQECKGL